VPRDGVLTGIAENGITGDLLMVMDAESLKELGLSVGQRLAILKAVYLVKLAHDIPIGEDDYIPPCMP
jgi:protein STE50